MKDEITITKKELLENIKFINIIEKQKFPFYIGDEVDEFERSLCLLNANTITEGLIRTYPYDFVIQRLFEFGMATGNDKTNVIYVYLKDCKRFKELDGRIQSFGYFISQLKLLPVGEGRTPYNYKTYNNISEVPMPLDKYSEVWVVLEQKFDRTIDPSKIQFLYHLTEKKYLEKIKKNGLIPKSKGKKSYHPDRIYITTDIEKLNNIITQFTLEKNKEDFVILKIDYTKAGKPILYNDPNFMDYGYYVIDNISPNAIIETITL